MLLHTQILFIQSNKINKINVYSNKLVNNLHIMISYKLHNKDASRACRARRFERVEPVELDVSSVSSESSSSCRVSTSSTQLKCMGSTRRTCRVVLCLDETSQVEFGLCRWSIGVPYQTIVSNLLSKPIYNIILTGDLICIHSSHNTVARCRREACNILWRPATISFDVIYRLVQKVCR